MIKDTFAVTQFLICHYEGKNQHFLAVGGESTAQGRMDLITPSLPEAKPGLNLNKPDFLVR